MRCAWTRSDSRAPYYLGNLLYDWQPQQAQALWEKSASLGADFPVVYRNLAMVYTRQGNQREKAQAALEKGVQYGGNATVLSDLDKLYEEKGVSPAKRLALMEAHQGVIESRRGDRARDQPGDLCGQAGRGDPTAALALLPRMGGRRSVLAGRLVDQRQPGARAPADGCQAVRAGAGRLPGGAAGSGQSRGGDRQCERPPRRD